MATSKTNKRSTSLRAHVHRHVKLALVPHKANQYRPHAIRRYGIALIVAVVFGLQSMYFGLVQGRTLGTQAQITSAGLLTATNNARSEAGEQPLVLNEQLVKAAELKVEDMFTNQYWAHVAPNGTTPWHWFGAAGYSYAEAGENLAKNFASSDSAVAAWLASPTHRANLLKADYKDVGFAVRDGTLDGKPTTLVVALYGTSEQTAAQGALASTQSSDMNAGISVMGRIGLGLRSLSPVAVSSIVVLLLAANIALVAHAHRRKLPLKFRRSWYRHHGLYKAIGLTSLAVVVVFAYGTIGQI